MMKRLGINIDIVSNTIHWDELSVPMVSQGHWTKAQIEAFCFMHFQPKQGSDEGKASTETSTPTKQVCFADSKPLKAAEVYITAAQLKQAHYKLATLDEIVGNNTHLTTDQKTKLLTTLKTHGTIFDWHRRDWKREK